MKAALLSTDFNTMEFTTHQTAARIAANSDTAFVMLLYYPALPECIPAQHALLPDSRH